MRVVPAFDPLEHRHAGVGLRFEGPSLQHFAFQGCEEALRQCIVVGIGI